MLDITKIDKNFAVDKNVAREGMVFYNPLEAPFSLHGIIRGENCFYRMPPDIAKTVSPSVDWLNYNTAGGRIRFATSSPYVAIFVKYKSVSKMPHFAFCGSIGFDLYADNLYIGTFQPRVDTTDTLESIVNIPGEGMRDITLNFPLYSSVSEIYLGLDKDATVGAAKPYSNEKPIVYYGSSITQGGCASRPGNSYEAMISRKYNVDHRNFGFSGNCKGEAVLARYFSELDISVFVCDYDHNTPNAEHLEATYFPFYEEFRKKQPNTPYIMVTRTDCLWNAPAYVERCRDIIHNAYLKAKEQGDENVYFIDGGNIFAGEQRGSCVVDGGHPTDIGFLRMSEVIGALVGKLLENK